MNISIQPDENGRERVDFVFGACINEGDAFWVIADQIAILKKKIGWEDGQTYDQYLEKLAKEKEKNQGA